MDFGRDGGLREADLFGPANCSNSGSASRPAQVTAQVRRLHQGEREGVALGVLLAGQPAGVVVPDRRARLVRWWPRCWGWPARSSAA
jgi:hypothetical protein